MPSLAAPLCFRVLAKPWLNRAIATIACIPFAYYGYLRYQQISNAIPLISLWVLLTIPMIVRRSPKRVTPNPVYWPLGEVVVVRVDVLPSGNRAVVVQFTSHPKP